jgi:hypothetical protein
VRRHKESDEFSAARKDLLSLRYTNGILAVKAVKADMIRMGEMLDHVRRPISLWVAHGLTH